MMTSTTVLNPFFAPLNTTCLIEASAGTGKTYTITSLYLRLLLQAGENCFERPLRVEEILVVTFTESATAELKGRIRERIHQANQAFQRYLKEKNQLAEPTEQALASLRKNCIQDDFVQQLLCDLEPDLDLAIQRLTLAERSMDLAAISTIHSFCHSMLMQYAFHSGVHFDLEISQNLDDRMEKISQEIWRQHFYHQPLEVASYVHRVLKSPANMWSILKNFCDKPLLPVATAQPELLQVPLSQLFENYILPQQEKARQQILQFKQQWRRQAADIATLVLNEINKPSKAAKALPGKIYQKTRTENSWLPKILQWAEEESDFALPATLTSYFSQRALNEKAPEDVQPLSHPLFEQVDELIAIQSEQEKCDNLLIYQYCLAVYKALLAYKSSHKEKSFTDLLRLLYEALQGTQGDELASFIRRQYPFAMIDEFQDTDQQQYGIFQKVYIQKSATPSGFMMIGDPKQAIYKFRGADIFTYLKAVDEAEVRLTLDKNWRSEQSLVDSVNALFDFKQGKSFIYPQIEFTPVKAKSDQARFILNGQMEPAIRCYIQEPTDNDTEPLSFAQGCAISIQQWLKAAEQKRALLRSTRDEKILLPERIAVLVRSGTEAAEVQQELTALGIASVYLSDKSSVYESVVGSDLLAILHACLNPFSERHILNAIGCRLWQLGISEISQIKQDENRWSAVVDRFVDYQQRWFKQGILAMLHHLFLQEKITQHLLAKVGGDREVTDLLHLAELLQKASSINESPASLLHWFETQINGEGAEDDAQIRLESEHQLVKIVTVHKSKGLEYDLVWLPFISSPVKKYNGLFNSYYDAEQQKTKMDFDGNQEEAVWQETLAEEMRLLYVALTRAKYQVVLALPLAAQPAWNALQYALCEGDETIFEKQDKKAPVPSMRTLLASWQRKLTEKNAELMIENINQLQASAPLAVSHSQKSALHSAQFTGNIEQNWQVSSFSSLAYTHERILQFKQQQAPITLLSHSVSAFAQDYDERQMPLANINSFAESDSPRDENASSAYPLGYSPFDLPAGAKIGKYLHHFLEKIALNRPLENESIALLCEQMQLTEEWQVPLHQWLNAVLSTPLLPADQTQGENVCLSNLKGQDCLKELGFYLQMKTDFDVAKFNQLLAQYYPEAEPLQLDYPNKYNSQVKGQIKGLLRGFVDLVFRHQGKFYILDYKSNLLGGTAENYTADNLQKVIQQQHYHWQYLFYTLALHRYLTLRVADYQYERDFGGVIYPFLRAMNGETNQGVYFHKPAAALIEKLGELF
ncbi:exodeoxyribonuclease V subunit beta [[Haemophilus] felis]|uniref:RecBCD enzyme subunit RecB n=1 Tax=[Haemophilus] felis TaxID=123822 RepID=A0A1T0B6N3_9PAST|nr:exodeoxyribonuclease V subunit beta [[Haemophilus] felis]